MRAHQTKHHGESEADHHRPQPGPGKHTNVEDQQNDKHGPLFADGADWENLDGEGGDRKLASASRKGNKDSTVEHLAKVGKTVFDEVNHALESFEDKLSEYSGEDARLARAWLDDQAATCGPSSAQFQRRVDANAHTLGNFYLARLLREAGVQARNLAKSSHTLAKDYDKDHVGSLLTFVRDAIESAKAISTAWTDYNKDISAVDDVVYRIGTRCGEQPKIPISPKVDPLVLPKPKWRIQLNPKITAPGGLSLGLDIPGVKVPGKHQVVPKALPHSGGAIQLIA